MHAPTIIKQSAATLCFQPHSVHYTVLETPLNQSNPITMDIWKIDVINMIVAIGRVEAFCATVN